MRICIDIDGTICEIKKPEEAYKDVKPIPGAALKIKQLKEEGAYIILCTARHMKTCNANVGQVLARQGETLLTWLKEHDFVYDELWLGKPYADIYIDDKALKFDGSWEGINTTLISEYL